GKPDHALVGVGVPHGADEQHLAARRGVSDRVPHLVHGQRRFPDDTQPDLTHVSTLPRMPGQGGEAIKRVLNHERASVAGAEIGTHRRGCPAATWSLALAGRSQLARSASRAYCATTAG